MKYLLFVSLFLFSALIAQESQSGKAPQKSTANLRSTDETLPKNYEVTLNFVDEDGQPIEVAFIVASKQFNVTLGEQNLSFSGTVNVEDSENIVVAYVLEWKTAISASNGDAQLVSSAAKNSVHVKLGEEIQIVRVGSRIARLSIKEQNASKAR